MPSHRHPENRLSDALRSFYISEQLESRLLLSTASPVDTRNNIPAPAPLLTKLSLSRNPIPVLKRSPGVILAMSMPAPTIKLTPPKTTTVKKTTLTITSTKTATKTSTAPTATPAAASPASSAPDIITGALAGKVLFTSGGHGYVWRPAVTNSDGSVTPGYWGFMRTYGYNFIEDTGNQDQITPYADYALRSGATIVAMRPVDHQVNEFVMDNAMGYSASTGGFQIISGTWTANTSTVPYWSVNNGNDTAHWVFASASATETAVARYTPNIPVAGYYPIYEWTNPGQNNSSNDRLDDQTYRINYTGGSTEVKVAADKVGNGWVYLGSYYFAQGVTAANVEVSNKTSGSTSGKYAVADGIRFGNGMGDWTGAGTTAGTHPISGYPREDECALYWCYDSRGWNGASNRVSTSVVDANFGYADENLNFFACDRYAAYMNNSAIGKSTDRLWISFHSNASGDAGTGGTGRGTYGLVNDGPTTPNQEWLAETAGYGVQQDMLAAGFNWASKDDGNAATTDDNVFVGGYSEISNSSSYINGEFDATIIEVAYHDNATDNALLKNPAVRDAVGRSAYHTAVKYFQTFDSLTNTTVLPEAPIHVRATTDASGNVIISWDPGASSTGLTGPYGNAATSYRVHTSSNGYGFDGGVVTTGTSLTISGLSTSAPTYFMVTAINSGGESEESYVVVAKPQLGRPAPILIVNNFDRMDGASDQIETKYVGTTAYMLARARARYNNAYDYVIQAASSLSAYNSSLDIESATDESIALGQVNLSNYSAVIWMSGEESTGDTGTFRGAAATAVTNYLNAGGKLFVSGSEIAWDLGAQNNGPTFLANTLHATYVADDAATYNYNAGLTGTALAGVSAGAFDDGTHGTYDVDYPDVLGAGTGAQVAMYYAGGTKAAAIQWSSGNSKLVYLGFPIESIYTQSSRNALIAAVMNYFAVTATAAPGTPALTAASDTGSSSSDRITRLNNAPGKTLQFIIPSTLSGATVKLYDGTTIIGQGTGNGGSLTLTTNGTATLADGLHTLTATQTQTGSLESAASPSLSITIDTTAPTATFTSISSPKTSSISSEAITFSESIAGLSAPLFSLTRDGSAVDTSGSTLAGSGSSFTLSNLSSSTSNAGHYALSLFTTGITDLAGNSLAAAPSVSWLMNTINTTPASDALVLARGSTPSQMTVTLNGNSYSLSLTGLGQLYLNLNIGSNPDSVTFDFSNGTPFFDVGMTIAAKSTDAISFIGSSFNDSVSISSNGAIFNSLPITFSAGQPATFSFAGGAGSDSLTVTSRSISFPTDASLTTSNLTLNLGAGASAFFSSAQHLAALNLSDTATASLAAGGNNLIVAGSLSLADSSSLDVADNDMILTSTTPDTIRQYLLTGSLFSSSAAFNHLHTTALGYALSSDLGVTSFAGQSLSSPSLLIKYTYNGDTNLDGKVDADDLARIDRGVAKHLSTWLAGDSNYDGIIDSSDLTLAYTAFRDQGPIL
ncbi:MAG TPA: Ig-like domain-containing protein [Tepidisphaeraceae bacterium]|jgi:hypothetical protein|nr:Ig-like domain-containing protein [Tepidisphaeraceae bacterium]